MIIQFCVFITKHTLKDLIFGVNFTLLGTNDYILGRIRIFNASFVMKLKNHLIPKEAFHYYIF